MHISKWLFAPKLIYAENSSEWNLKKKSFEALRARNCLTFVSYKCVWGIFVFKTRPLNSMLIYPRQSDFKDTSTITTGYCWNEGLTSRQCFIYNKTCLILYYSVLLNVKLCFKYVMEYPKIFKICQDCPIYFVF